MLECKTLTLEKAVDICRASEVARNTRAELHRGAIAKVSAYKRQKSQTRGSSTAHNGNQMCMQCGYRRHKDSAACPANGGTCRKCGESGHFQAVCRCADTDTSDASTEWVAEGMSTPITARWGERRHRQHRYVRQTIADVYTRGADSRPTPRVLVRVTHPAGSDTVHCTPDTGAETTVMGSQLAHHLGIEVDNLLPAHTSFIAVGGNLLQCKGQIGCSLELGKRQVETSVHITDNISGMLISWFDCIALGIVPADFPKQIGEIAKSSRILHVFGELYYVR
ncbi:hypothetical protein Pcinc_027638 [Petrolisthes cinctipes]|uniref:CCHC-type domain-containing protein n=1 Tax=Petrolisthes cinctipes TaxID=88211 RepID=A0AAE1KAI8_PETCI|nr:hypothetical protein Pcinc_027638 [Petrolisthes cinctipes]